MDQDYKNSQLKTSQTLLTVAFIGGPVSLLIGGFALSTAALVCAIIALMKVRKVLEPSDGPGSIARSLYIQSLAALGISAIATTLNLVAVVYMFQAMTAALQSGDLSSLFGAFGDGSSMEQPADKSIWD